MMALISGADVSMPAFELQKDSFNIHHDISLHFNGHFSVEPRASRCLLMQRIMAVVVTTGLLEL